MFSRKLDAGALLVEIRREALPLVDSFYESVRISMRKFDTKEVEKCRN